MVLVTKGDFVWIEPLASSPDVFKRLPVGARVLSSERGRLLVLDDTGREEWLEADRRVKLMHPTSVQGREDMIELGDLHEAAVLRNICIRYKERLIYTYTGTILIAVNPFSAIPIYTADEVRMYRRRRFRQLPPHIFAVADNAYTSMRTTGQHQSIIISGESGSGKTESTKHVLQFIAAASGQHSWIEQQILEATPVLEAFGNAKTICNDNSSRFGKYIDVHFNSDGAIQGARIDHYLLEKSRIVSHAAGERNYHIFYYLLNGLSKEKKAELGLGDTQEYLYLNQGGDSSNGQGNEGSAWAEVRSAMKILFFQDEEVDSMIRLLAAVLHIGNIKFYNKSEEEGELVSIFNNDVVAILAKLLQVREADLLAALTTRTLSMHGDIVVASLSPQTALDTRDALSKAIYGRLFGHLLARINATIADKSRDGASRPSIGVLDIFGFEVFTRNSFEQLCINYANEALQQFFLGHVFKLEQREYQQEQIEWRHIKFEDNQPTLDLLSSRPMNIFALLDEESIFPKGTDSTLLTKLHSTHSESSSGRYIRPRSDLQKAFGVKHYAGPVSYHVQGFLEKNRDTFSSDLAALVASSSFRFLFNIFDAAYSDVCSSAARKRAAGTVGAQFRRSLDQLILTLSQTQPFFVRCIKPNDDKHPMLLDRALVLRQLHNSGMLDAIRIRRSGYPIRYEYAAFTRRFAFIVPSARGYRPKEATRIICETVLGRRGDFALGNTKVFLKDDHDLHLELECLRIQNESAKLIQRRVRGWLVRKEFLRQRRAAVHIQKNWKGFSQRRRYAKMRAGFERLQALARARQLSASYAMLRELVVLFQARARGALIRSKMRQIIDTGTKRPKMVNGEEEKKDVEEDNDIDLVNELFDFLPREKIDTRHEAIITECSGSSLATSSFEDLSSYDFAKFAATYFQVNGTSTFSPRPLTAPLLHIQSPITQKAALAVWTTILRFMGTIPDAPEMDDATGLTPVMARLHATLGRQDRGEEERKEGREGGLARAKQKVISMTLRKKSRLPALDAASSAAETIDALANAVEAQSMSSLDKLHFIIGMGILRPELRDEIYCQLCKQLLGNPSKVSVARGWILLSLCVGCFAPSERLMKYLLQFIRTRGPPGYATFVEERLQRTIRNGTRKQPPTYVELQANKSRKPILLAVTLMDGSVRTVHADSAATAAEVCSAISEKIGLVDRFGFSLYIALYDKVSSLGAGSDHVMDAISQCEQYAKEQGKSERTAPWRLFFRKEIFSPWHDPKSDTVSTTLIYEQIVRGVRYGEYRCEKEDDLALLIAQQYCIQEGTADVDSVKLEKMLPSLLPDFELNNNNHGTEKWMQMVMHAYRMKLTPPKSSTASEASIRACKEEVVLFAKLKWPLLFSRFYEARQMDRGRSQVVLAVNWTGVYVVGDAEEIINEFSFPEIAKTASSVRGDAGLSLLTLTTIAGDEFTYEGAHSDDVKELVDDFLKGLKRRSRYLVAVNPQKSTEDSLDDDLLEMERGDLLILSPGLQGQLLLSETYVRGENTRTGEEGRIKSDNVYVLPTMTRPTATAMEMFPRDWMELSQLATTSNNNDENDNEERGVTPWGPLPPPHNGPPHTLQRYAADHFKASSSSSSWARTFTRRRKRDENGEEGWRHSRTAIRAPLLKKLHTREEPAAEAVAMFAAILQYMGDTEEAPRGTMEGTATTDRIFGPALKYDALRDELYCQLIRQLTLNPSPLSENCGWELLWLATGLTAPSYALAKEVSLFLHSCPHPLSADCLRRMAAISKMGSRKFPSHQVEVDAIQRRTTQLFHKVLLPDQSEDVVRVSSEIRASDLVKRMAATLRLRSADGFALFVKVGDKVLSIPESEFFFDFLRQLTDPSFQAIPQSPDASAKTTNRPYRVFLMRKLWVRVHPREDRVADLIFHFHQELPKYLHGYHPCSHDEAARMAALLLRVRTREDSSAPLPQLALILNELLPRDILKAHSSSEWKKRISREYATVSALSPDDAKTAFLDTAARWPTFGSAFFTVKQTTDPSLPDRLLVAINSSGFSLYHPDSKALLSKCSLQSISTWSTGNTYFHICVANNNAKNANSRMLLETSMGYKMDDLLTAYIAFFIGEQTKNPNLMEGTVEI